MDTAQPAEYRFINPGAGGFALPFLLLGVRVLGIVSSDKRHVRAFPGADGDKVDRSGHNHKPHGYHTHELATSR